MVTVWRMALKMGLEVCNHWNFTRGPILALNMTLEEHTGGKGHKPFFFPFIQRKIKGEHARTAIKGERSHEKTTARFVCRRREGNLLSLVIVLHVVWKCLSGLYCEPVWACRYAHCPSSRVDRGKNHKRIMTKTRAGYLHFLLQED